MTRWPIYAAILAQLQGLQQSPYSLPIQVISADWLPYEQCGDKQPAIFLAPEEEESHYERPKVFTRWTVHAYLWVYCQRPDPEATVGGLQTLTAILDGIEAILMPKPGNVSPVAPNVTATSVVPGVNTLGGLITPGGYLAIQGATVISPGYLGNQLVARVPLEIVTA